MPIPDADRIGHAMAHELIGEWETPLSDAADHTVRRRVPARRSAGSQSAFCAPQARFAYRTSDDLMRGVRVHSRPDEDTPIACWP